MRKIKIGKSDKTLPDWTLAKKNIPQWYKDVPSVNEKNLKFDDENKPFLNIKSCMPIFDSFASGYMINLWCDIHVEQNEENEGFVKWGRAEPEPVAFRNPAHNPIPVPLGCSSFHYIWRIPYSFSLPSGYSALITHPLNRYDLPFVSMSGIIDADPLIPGGNFPFFIKKDFNGIIPAGTPIVQVIPFKRESWKIENSEDIEKKAVDYRARAHRKFLGYYKQNVWKKKQYE